MSFYHAVSPPSMGRPQGYAHGLLAGEGGRVLFIAGQTAFEDAPGDVRAEGRDFASQFDDALARVLQVVTTAGGSADRIGRMTIFVVSMDAYLRARPVLGESWRRRMGRHYPAVTLVEVSRLMHPHALVEIEATAVL